MTIAMDKDDIARVRAIPLEAVLQHLGAAPDPKDPAHNWRLGASRITVTDARFYDHNQAGALHRASGNAAIVIAVRQHGPALMLLAENIRPAGFALSLQRVKGLFQPFLGGLSSVDGTPDVLLTHRCDPKAG